MKHKQIGIVGLSIAFAALLLATGQLAWSGSISPSVPEQLKLTNTELPDATVGSVYHCLLTASGGKKPYDYSAAGLPEGLALGITQFQDTISGTPKTAGTFSVTITTTDSTEPTPATASVILQLKVLPRAGK